MIGFMLDDPGLKIVDGQFETLAATIESSHLDLTGSRHTTTDVRNAQAPFPVFHDLVSEDGNLRVDYRQWLGFRVSVAVGLERRHEETQPFVDLRSGQANAVVFEHRVDHVVDE